MEGLPAPLNTLEFWGVAGVALLALLVIVRLVARTLHCLGQFVVAGIVLLALAVVAVGLWDGSGI